MKESQELYNLYIYELDKRVDEIKLMIEDFKEKQEFILSRLTDLNEILVLNNFKISSFITDPLNHFYTKSSLYIKINPTPKEQLCIDYIKRYNNNYGKINQCNDKIKELTYNRVSYSVYKTVCDSFNFEISKHILEGYCFHFFGKLKGKLHIKEMNNNKDTRIDWGASNKLKAELESKGIPIFSPECLTGQKWFVYCVQDFNYWWVWERPFLANYSLYNFRPTNGCNTKDRSQTNFLATCKKKEDILNTTLIGNKDKMFALLKFDALHYLKYRNNRNSELIEK